MRSLVKSLTRSLTRPLIKSLTRLSDGGAPGPTPLPTEDFVFNLDEDASPYRLNGDDFIKAPGNLASVKGSALIEGQNHHWDFGAFLSTIQAIGSGSFTWMFWIKSSEVSTSDIVATESGADGDGFRIGIQSNRLYFFTNNTTMRTTPIFENGRWMHVCIDCDGSGQDLRYYVNGVLDSTHTAPTYDFALSNNFIVGANENQSTRFLYGGLNYLRLWVDEIFTIEKIAEQVVRYDYEETDNTEAIEFWDPMDRDTVDESGGLINSIAGQVNSVDLVKDSDATRPTIFSNKIGINEVVTANGVNQYLQAVSFTGEAMGNSYLCYPIQYRNSDSNLDAWTSFNGANGRDFQHICGSQSGNRNQMQLINPGVSSTPGPIINLGIAEVVLDWDAQRGYIYMNGVLIDDIPYDTTAVGGAGIFRILQKEVPSPNTSPDGDIGKVFISSRPQDQADGLVRRAMAWDHGLQGLQPVTDPAEPPRKQDIMAFSPAFSSAFGF